MLLNNWDYKMLIPEIKLDFVSPTNYGEAGPVTDVANIASVGLS